VQAHIKSGKVRALAIGTAQRSLVMPELQTVAEAGVSGYEANNWNGVVVPVATPRAVIDRLQREIRTIVSAPDMRNRLLQSAFEPVADSPDAFRRYLDSEKSKWSRVVREAGIRPE
jgi:tripartite-type tricarboxylate transporter receptor subunit TctC